MKYDGDEQLGFRMPRRGVPTNIRPAGAHKVKNEENKQEVKKQIKEDMHEYTNGDECR